MYIIISHARCGSTYLNEYVKRANRAIPIAPSAEFFNRRWSRFETIEPTLENLKEKINFLEKERIEGREYSVKVLAYQVKTCREWFDKFYKDWDKIILLRKDRWRAFLSYEIQSYLKWNSRTTHNRQDEMISNLKPFLIDLPRVKRWFDEYILLETHKGSRIYLEDISHDSLCNFFNLDFKQNFHKYTTDYEPYILNLEEIKLEFYKQENNFYPHQNLHHQRHHMG
jgi:hypothetical protein